MRKHIKIQTLCTNNSSDNDKNDHDVHITTNNYEFNSDRLCKHSKN